MRRDDRDDPFDEFFEEIERMMNEMIGDDSGFGAGRSAGPAGQGSTDGDLHVDIHETEEAVRVVADLPGVSKEAIELRCDGTVLHVQAAGDAREYRERIDLPVRVNEHSADATYNNGVLEVRFDRAEESTNIDL